MNLKKSLLVQFTSQGFSALFALLSVALVARYLGPHDYGIIAYPIALFAFIRPIRAFGIEQFLNNVYKENSESLQLFKGSIILYLLTSFFLLIITSVLYAIFNDPNDSNALFVFIYAISSILSVGNLYEAPLLNSGKANLSSFSDACAYGVKFGSDLVLVLIGAKAYMFAFPFLIWQIVRLKMKSSLSGLSLSQDSLIEFPKFKQLLPFFAVSMSVSFYTLSDQMMINFLSPNSSTELGFYSTSAKLFSNLNIIIALFTLNMIPIIKSTQSFLKLPIIKKMLRLLWSISISVSIIIFISASGIVNILFGSQFIESTPIIRTLSLSFPFFALASFNSRLLVTSGYQSQVAKRCFLSCVVNILLNIFLIPSKGAEGAAIATLISILFQCFVMPMLGDKFERQVLFYALKPL